jgi:UDP-N-acetylmuramate dehydrogenase
MNAGGFGGETWALVKEVTIMNRQGQTRIAYPRDFKISYRSALGLAKDEFFISALFELKKGDVKAAQKKIKTLLELRSETQPIGEATCGSVFKNPANMFAAKLIEDTGLKGLRQGDAMVSIKHANFIVNQGDAKATDIEYLINKIQQRILEKQGILLEPEVKIVGDIQ